MILLTKDTIGYGILEPRSKHNISPYNSIDIEQSILAVFNTHEWSMDYDVIDNLLIHAIRWLIVRRVPNSVLASESKVIVHHGRC